jgi:hypothetical protein
MYKSMIYQVRIDHLPIPILLSVARGRWEWDHSAFRAAATVGFGRFFAPWALGASQASSTARNWKRRCRKGLSLGHGWWPWDETHHDSRNFIRCWVGRCRKFGTAKPLSAKHLELEVLTLIYDKYWLVFKASRHMAAAIQAFLSVNLHDSSRRKRMRAGGMLICPGRLVAGTTPQLCQ